MEAIPPTPESNVGICLYPSDLNCQNSTISNTVPIQEHQTRIFPSQNSALKTSRPVKTSRQKQTNSKQKTSLPPVVAPPLPPRDWERNEFETFTSTAINRSKIEDITISDRQRQSSDAIAIRLKEDDISLVTNDIIWSAMPYGARNAQPRRRGTQNNHLRQGETESGWTTAAKLQLAITLLVLIISTTALSIALILLFHGNAPIGANIQQLFLKYSSVEIKPGKMISLLEFVY